MKRHRRHHSEGTDSQESDDSVILDDENRKIFLFGQLTEIKAMNFLMAIQSLDSKGDSAITVVINSPGGNTHAGYTIYDAINYARSPVVVEGYGKVFSMAVLVLQAGDKRFLSPQAEVMVHNVYAETEGEMTVKEVARLATNLRSENQRYQRLVAERIGMKVSEFATMCDEETFMDAETAIRLGFADAILLPKKKPKGKKR